MAKHKLGTECIRGSWTLSVFAFCLTAGITTQQSLPAATPQQIDCYPESPSPSQRDCRQRNCIFSASPSPGQPACYYDTSTQGYRVTSRDDTSHGFRVHLTANGEAPFHRIIRRAVMDVEMLSNDVLRINVGNTFVFNFLFVRIIPLI